MDNREKAIEKLETFRETFEKFEKAVVTHFDGVSVSSAEFPNRDYNAKYEEVIRFLLNQKNA